MAFPSSILAFPSSLVVPSSPSKFKLYCLDLLFGNGKLTRSFVFKLNPDPFQTRTQIHSRPEPLYDPKPKEKYGMGRVFDPKTKTVSTRGLYGSTPFFSKYFVIFFSLVCFFLLKILKLNLYLKWPRLNQKQDIKLDVFFWWKANCN